MVDNLKSSHHDMPVQRSAPTPEPLLVPVEGPVRRHRRKTQMARLDALLLAVEDFNDAYGPETAIPPAWVVLAGRLGCLVAWPLTGAKLHAALLNRQEALVLPVYERRGGRLHRLTETGSLPTALRFDDVREIA